MSSVVCVYAFSSSRPTWTREKGLKFNKVSDVHFIIITFYVDNCTREMRENDAIDIKKLNGSFLNILPVFNDDENLLCELSCVILQTRKVFVDWNKIKFCSRKSNCGEICFRGEYRIMIKLRWVLLVWWIHQKFICSLSENTSFFINFFTLRKIGKPLQKIRDKNC